MKETRGRYQEKENDLDIARAVLKKKRKATKFTNKTKKRELFGGPCPTSDTKCCNLLE
jgi:hypothetical protein